MGRREEKKAEARQRISNVATALFLEKGFDAVSVAEVAAAAQVSTMTVFNYFPRKEDLLLDRGDEARALVCAAVLERAKGRTVVDAIVDGAERLVAEVHSFTKWTVQTEDYFRMVSESPSLLARVRELRELVETELEAALRAATDAPDDDVVARILAVSIVAAWRSAHRAATSAWHAGRRGDALGRVFLRTLDDALEPVRRAAHGTRYASRSR